MSNESKKFTATLVTESDKEIVVGLRNETNLSEKELMTLVIKHTNVEAIKAEAAVLVAANEADKAARKAAAYEALKAKMKEQREAAKAARPPKAPKAAKAPKGAPVPATA